MAKKTLRINEQEVCVKASNAVYNGSISGADNAQSAIDSLDERVANIEQNEGSTVISGTAVPLTLNDDSVYDIQRVFTKGAVTSEELESVGDWQFMMSSFVSPTAVSVVNGETQIKFVIEVQSSTGALGTSDFSLHWYNFFNNYNAATRISHVYDGVKDVYTYKGVAKQTGSYSSTAGDVQFKINGLTAGTTIKMSAYLVCGGQYFVCKNGYFSATGNTNSKTALPLRNEWEDTAVTVDKANALIDNRMLPMCSSGSEYDPFLSVNTTPRTIVTIVSDDAALADYTGLRNYMKSAEDTWNTEHQNDEGFVPVDIHWSISIPSNYAALDENSKWTRTDGINSESMTVRMIRDLVANYGVSVLSHNYNHDYIYTGGGINLTEAEQLRIFTNSRYQIERAIGVPCIHHCLPGGASNNYTYAALSRVFISTCTTNSSTFNTPDSGDVTALGVTYPKGTLVKRYDMTVGGVSDNVYGAVTKIQEAQTYVANNNKSAWVCFCTHGQSYGVHHQYIKAVVEYCLANGIPLLNYSEAFAEMYPAIDRLKALLGINS